MALISFPGSAERMGGAPPRRPGGHVRLLDDHPDRTAVGRSAAGSRVAGISVSSTAISSRWPSRTRSSGSSPTSPVGTSAPSPNRCRPGCPRANSRRSSNSPTRRWSSERPDSAMSMLPDSIHHLSIGHRSGTDYSDDPLPDAISPAWKAPTSGGSTGRPKLIVSGDPAVYDTEAPLPLGLAPRGVWSMPGPLYHNGPGGLGVPGAAVGQPRRRCSRSSTRRTRSPRSRPTAPTSPTWCRR